MNWKVPPTVELGCSFNTDDCYQKESNLARGGSILTDYTGNWLCGFSVILGTCSAVEAELWALIHGLRLVWEKSIQCLVVEINSLLAYTWITKQEPKTTRYSNLVTECKHLIKRSWAVDLQHVYRERNQAVDFLAAMSLR